MTDIYHLPKYTYAQLRELYAIANGLNITHDANVLKHCNIMAGIGVAESGGDPAAKNPSGASGLWQIMPSHTSDPGWSFGTNYFDPATNARMAEFVYKKQGYQAWTTYGGKAYTEAMGGNTMPTTDNAGVVQGVVNAVTSPFTAILTWLGNLLPIVGFALLAVVLLVAGIAILVSESKAAKTIGKTVGKVAAVVP